MIISDGILPEERTPNIAFFSLLIEKIEQSETLHLIHDFLNFIPKLGLCVPKHLSSFLRFIRRNTVKAFQKQKFSPLSVIPALVLPESSVPNIGPLCQEAGISENWLLNSSALYNGPATITVGILLELNCVRHLRGASYDQCASWVQRLFKLDSVPHSGTIRKQWGRIVRNASNAKSDRNAYAKLPYRPPCKPVPGPASKPPVSDAGPTNGKPALAAGNSDMVPAITQIEAQCEKQVLSDMEEVECKLDSDKTQLSDLQDQILSATSTLEKIRKQIGHYNTKNVNKRDKRSMMTRATLYKCQNEMDILKAKMVSLAQKETNALKLKSKWKTMAEQCSNCATKDSKISQLNDRVLELENENVLLSETVSDLSNVDLLTQKADLSNNVETLEVRDGHVGYSDSVRLVYMQLLSLGVSVGKCSEVVSTVLAGLTPCKADKLPSKSTTSGFQSECETLAQMHVADVILHSENVTLSLDGTKKKFKEYGSFQVTHSELNSDKNEKETLSVGIQEMARGDTNSFIETLDSLFKDLAETYSEDLDRINQIKTQMIANIKNLMTDRHIVNKTFKDKFEGLRRDLFTKHLDGFKSLPKDQQDHLVELHGLFCGLHVLANMGTEAAKALKVYEEIALPESAHITSHAFNKGNARSFDLVFEISQSMTVSGSQRFGRLADWEAFLHSIGETNRIVSFLRHRFNVLFVDGAAIYYHREHIAQFLETLPESNKLLLCIKDSIDSPICLAALRALGIIAVLITQPLWQVVEQKDVHIFDLNPQWLHLELSLKELSIDASSLLQGISIFPERPTHKDDVFEELFKPVTTEMETLTKECLELLCFHLHSLVKRQVVDQLPGGKYSLPSEEVLKATKSCPTTNRAGEKDFSDLDREVNRAPQRSPNHISGTICFRNNKTWRYFKILPAERRQTLLMRAMKSAPLRRRRNRERQKEVKIVRKRFIDESKAKKEAKLRKAFKARGDLEKRIVESGGVWLTAQDVKKNVAKLKTKGKQTQALKDQLRYHQRSQASPHSKLTQFSTGSIQFGPDKLSENLVAVLGLSVTAGAAPRSVENIPCLHPKEQRLQMLADHRNAKLALMARPTVAPVAKTTLQQKTAKKILKKAVSLKRIASLEGTHSQDAKRFNMKFAEGSMPVNSFVAVAFDDNWYLGQVIELCSPEEADINYMKRVGQSYFQWPSPPDKKKTKALYVLQGNVAIAPRDSGLRMWKICSTSTACLDKEYKQYQEEFM